MLTLRRLLFLIAFAFWQGGFTFYASIVVPIGTDELRSSLKQGFITRRVTHSLNVAGALSLVPFGWDCLAADPSRLRKRLRLGLWGVLALTLVGLFYLHDVLGGMMQRQGWIVQDPGTFHSLHRLYLWMQTVQWGVGLVFLLLTVLAWRGADRHQKRCCEAVTG